MLGLPYPSVTRCRPERYADPAGSLIYMHMRLQAMRAASRFNGMCSNANKVDVLQAEAVRFGMPNRLHKPLGFKKDFF
jgi:hypothetical protein